MLDTWLAIARIDSVVPAGAMTDPLPAELPAALEMAILLIVNTR